MHQLAVNDVYCALRYRTQPDGADFLRWLIFADPIDGIAIQPDGYAELTVLGDPVALFFEIDLGTEHRSVWQDKVRAYLEFAASGKFERQFRRARFRALVITNSETRLKPLRTWTAEITEKIFRFTTLELIAQQSFWGAIWQNPRGDEQFSLFPNL